MKIVDYIRSAYFNIVYFKTLSKRCYFGRRVKIIGNINFSNHITLDDNVEINSEKFAYSSIGAHTSINRNTVIRGSFRIGEYCAIAPNCMIIGNSHVFSNSSIPIKKQGYKSKGVVIEDDVWIGANAVILDGTIIGKGSVIGAGSIVTKSIPPYSIAYGNPCKVRKKR